MNYSEAIQFLYDLRMFGAKLGLENTFKLAELAGNPQERLRFIHVSGTNGKGSTCAMLESICRAAGLRTGLFTSPHLVSFAERIQIDRQPISQPEVVRLVKDLRPLLKTFPPRAHPTFFEVVTIIALRYFAEAQCDIVIWETGLGGRLDATNIVTPLASVITSIALDHEKWLGSTLAEIAREKAGIIKPTVPVITSAAPGNGLEEIRQAAAERNSPLTIVNLQDADRPPLDVISLPLRGEFQRLNAALAIAVIRALADELDVSGNDIVQGLTRVQWPGRMQLVERDGTRILLDGAHNPAGAKVLCEEAQRVFANTRPTLVLGILADKDWQAMVECLAPMAGRILLTPVKSERTLAPATLLAACAHSNPEANVTAFYSLAEALQASRDDEALVITGSLYLVGEALELLGLSPAPAQDERTLNEWGPPVHAAG